jgi:HEAT repeat protein
MKSRLSPSLLLAATMAQISLGCSPGETAAAPEVMEINEPAAIAARVDGEIQSALSSSEAWIRAEAIRLVAKSGIAPLGNSLQAALTDPAPLVRFSSMEQLLPAGNRQAQDALLAAQSNEDTEGQIRLFRLAIRRGTNRFKVEIATFLLRQRSPETRRATLLEMRDADIGVDPALRDQLLNDPDADVADAAFAYLAEQDPPTALERVIESLRSSDAARRTRGMHRARHLTHADLWPTMRATATHGSEEQRFAAQCVLGRLGDSTVEEALRSVILTGTEANAALAVRAISNIRTPRAQSQASRQVDDPRAVVRRAALDVLLERGASSTEFEAFLADPDPTLGRRAMTAIIASDPSRAASLVSRQLGNEEGAERVLMSIHETAATMDLTDLLLALRDTLYTLSMNENDTIAGLATRLLARSEPAMVLLERARAHGGDQTLFSALEAAMLEPTEEMRPFLLEGLGHELRMIRFAAALVLLKLSTTA